MKIYLITPKNPESFWTLDRILPSLGKKCIFPNLSMPTVAALTPREHEIVLCDENVESVDFDTDADIVGVTGYVVHAERVIDILSRFLRRGKFVVAGGPLATLCPERLRAHADVLFVNEAEYTWPRFLKEYAAGTWQAEYRQEEKPDLKDSPAPRLDLIKAGKYRTLTLQFARGCPYQCEFCDIIVMYGRKPRTKSPAQILAEVEQIRLLGASNAFVVDDNFIGNKGEAAALLRVLAQWQEVHGYPLEFMTEVSINLSQDPELLKLMRRANFTTVFVGIESPRAQSLQEAHKTQNLRQSLVESVRSIQAAGIEVMAGMIVGFDGDDAAIFDEQFRFLQDAGIPVAMAGMLNAIPKTPLYERLKRAGRLAAESVGDQFVFTNVIPKGMSRAELYEGYRRLLRRLYGYRNYRRRAMRFILAHSRPERLSLPSRKDLGICLRVFWNCVLNAAPRRAWLTVSLVAETALRRPWALRRAVTFALLHKHLYEYMSETSRQLKVAARGFKAPGGCAAPSV